MIRLITMSRELLCAILFIISGLGSPVALAGANPETLRISDVTVIDPASESVTENQDVYIRGNRITTIQVHAMEPPFRIDETINGRGKFLIPGLMDMHVHIAHPKFSEASLALLIANGVTSVREMSGDCWEPRGEYFACIDEYRELQAATESGKALGPRLLAISSAIVRAPSERNEPHVPADAADFVTPSTPEQARQLVKYLADRNVDFIKVYNELDKATYFALLKAAQEHALPVAGHVPLSVSIEEAVSRGHLTVEHAKMLPYDCSDYGPELHDTVNALLAGNSNRTWLSARDRQQKVMDSFNADRCESVLQAMKDSGAWYVPTHETREMDARAAEDQYRNDQRLEYMPSEMKGFWMNDLNSAAKANAEADAETREVHQKFFQHGLRLTKLAHAAGVPIMLGTDANDTMSFPGFSAHDELQHLVAAGLSPMDALRAATTVPARFLGRSDDFGGVSAGMLADLVLLDANPLTDIRNTTRINTVFINGRFGKRDELNGILERIRQASMTKEPAVEAIELPATVLQQYAGKYVVPSSELEITMSVNGNGLQAEAKGMPLVTFYPESETLFFMREDATKFEFVMNSSGNVTGMNIIWTGGRSEFAPRQE